MADEITTTVGTRINLSLLSEIHHELQKSGKKISFWIKEAIEEKLQNDNSELLNARINYLKAELKILENKSNETKQKKKDISSINEEEMPFLLWSKKLLEINPNLIKGKIKDYKNRFSKNYRITIQDFYELVQNAEVQYSLINDPKKKEKVKFEIDKCKTITIDPGGGRAVPRWI